jgi:hypothetical protein
LELEPEVRSLLLCLALAAALLDDFLVWTVVLDVGVRPVLF